MFFNKHCKIKPDLSIDAVSTWTANQESSEKTMQNTKIQTLWNLCNELKEKRQFLVDRLKSTQDYLDQQQLDLSREVHMLRQQNHALEQNVSVLNESVEQVFQLVASSRAGKPESVSASPHDFSPLRDCSALHLELHGRFQAQDTILHLLEPEVLQVDAPCGLS